MKHIILISILVLFASSVVQAQGNIGIGTDMPDSSAILELSSKTKGFLPPRMTNAERSAIPNPVPGLIIWCTDCKALQVYDGTLWQNIFVAEFVPPFVAICAQSWMTKNLDVDTYNNGDPISRIDDNTTWANLTTGAYCYYDNDSATYAATYGKLYNWFAVNDPRGLAPQGWHIPTDAEWTTLENCLGGASVAGGSMKETGLTHWNSPNSGATNSSGFTGLPGGERAINLMAPIAYYFIGDFGGWWSSTEHSVFITDAWVHWLSHNNASTSRFNDIKQNGFSVRCIKD